MDKTKLEMNLKVQDEVTGYTGTVTAICKYLNGTTSALVEEKFPGGQKFEDGAWVDSDRLKVVS